MSNNFEAKRFKTYEDKVVTYVEQSNESQQTSYGVKEVVQDIAYIKASPVYGLVPANFREFTSDGGSTGIENREFKVSSGTTIYGYGAIQSFRSLNAEYGQTALCRFGARFPESVANSWQGCGLVSLTDELSFGLNGTDFGVWHRYGGEVEVRTFQITGAAGGSENATVTINGTAYIIPLTAGTVQHNAWQVATYLNTNATGYYAEQINDKVIVSAASDGAKSDTWSFSSSTATATVTRTTTGVTKTSTFIAQADFNGDVFEGFDYTKGNLYEIVYGAGYSDIRYSIYNPVLKKFETAHEIQNVSLIERTNVNNPSLRTGNYVASVGSTTNISNYCSFISAFVQGLDNPVRNSRAYSNTKSISTALTNILTIRNKRIYNGKINQGEIEPLALSISNEGNKTLVVELRGNPTVAGEPNYQDIGTNLIVEVDTAGTTVTSNGRFLAGLTVSPGDTAVLNLKELENRIPPTLNLVVAGKQITGGSAGDITATLIWGEDI